jgi:glutaminyl-tRNA synthetase
MLLVLIIEKNQYNIVESLGGLAMSEINNFIKTIMESDLKDGKVKNIMTRFPPEPNAYLLIGHARAIVMNFELAKMFGGKTNLRFDDTNPTKEGVEYVEAIKRDIEWLGYTPDNIFYGSDYFEEQYQRAILLIKKGKAFVCDLTQDEMAKYRGTLTEGGKNSPYRDRSVAENLDLFAKMRNGEFAEGTRVLRAKIDMASPNINMRDPVMYRILNATHHKTGNKWCIYPMYDFAHPLQDALEGITHSLCSIEFENHRPLYDWFIKECEMPHVSHQIEWGRLYITNTITSKRYLKQLVEAKKVSGYDDPRLPTLVGLKRRGYTPTSIKAFIVDAGLSRLNSTTPSDKLDYFLREDLKPKVARKNAILNPLKLIITNYPANQVEQLDVLENPENPEMGSRKLPFSREVYIERDDFTDQPFDKNWKRLAKGLEVRLMHAYFVKCNEIVYENNQIKEIHCTYDIETKSNSGFNGRKPNGNIHFVEASTALKAEFRLFGNLILNPDQFDENATIEEKFNENSVEVKIGVVEPSLNNQAIESKFQFVRHGYFSTDRDSKSGLLVFNRIAELKSSF